jgi:hypothetical protein
LQKEEPGFWFIDGRNSFENRTFTYNPIVMDALQLRYTDEVSAQLSIPQSTAALLDAPFIVPHDVNVVWHFLPYADLYSSVDINKSSSSSSSSIISYSQLLSLSLSLLPQ